ncbi:MAG: AAA family ATPase [Planctomycetes bacterium]|jgi:MoxR-like ATPase|nr:AAA family ATPase [Planctomycetota bacterium]
MTASAAVPATAYADAAQPLRLVEAEIAKILVGQRDLVRRLLIGLLTDSHLLLEGVPGLAKTTVVKTLARALSAKFSRIQFTPDLLPADIVGTRIYAGGQFTTRLGPVFAQIVLADEINRAPAKVQSALLEAMQERQVTIGDETFPLPRPFLVLATQNPLEQEGTYPLPEAQTDRFLMKVRVDYPSAADERTVLDRALSREVPEIHQVLTMEALAHAQRMMDAVHMDERLKDYCVSLVRATRDPKGAGIASLAGMIDVPASPRATIALAVGARAQAFLEGRGFVTPQDVKTIAPDVLRHRIHPSYEAEAESLSSDVLVQRLLEHVQVP